MELNRKYLCQNKEDEILLKTGKKVSNLKELGFIRSLRYVTEHITVEPAMAFYIMPYILASLATQNLNLEKACRVNLNFGDEVCTALKMRKGENFTFEEVEVQKLIASVQAWKSAAVTAVPTILLLFIGAWSDKTGRRKFFILMPIAGDMLTCILNMISTYFFQEISVGLAVLMEVLFPSFTGGLYMLSLGTYSYISDISTTETRTFRLGVLSMCMPIGYSIGMVFSGLLLRYIGYYGVFGLSATIHFFNFIYVLFGVDDHTWLQEKPEIERKGCVEHFKDFFNFKSVRDTLQMVFKKDENNQRLRKCLIMAVICLTYGPLWGEITIFYIFVRYRFNWDELTYSIYCTYGLIMYTIGTYFAISVFSKKLKIDDAVLGMISTISKICGCLVLAFARTNLEIFMAPIAEMLNGTTIIVVRSIASKLVSHQELGKFYSLFSLAETLMGFLFSPTYSHVYVMSLQVLPGAAFLLTVLAMIPSFFIFNWFYRQHRQDKRQADLILMNMTASSELKINIT